MSNIDGKQSARKITELLTQKIQQRTQTGKPSPGLAVVLVGDDPASEVYVRNKRKACEKVGIQSYFHHLSVDVSQDELLSLLTTLNKDTKVHGILVQLPLPNHIDENVVLDSIAAHKDVDGFHPTNIGKLAQRRPTIRPCTPFGVMKLLEQTGEKIRGKHAVVLGASNIVGRPMALELLLAGCTVTVCHKFTANLSLHVSQADILVVAMGKRGVLQSEWIKPGAIVIDVGIHRLDDGKIVGDVDYDTAVARASWITPVPGGVGPMTVAMLLWNTVEAARLSEN